MRPFIKYALRQEGISGTFTKGASYYTSILADSFNRVKKRIKSILRSFLDDEISGAEIQFSQEIHDPDGLVIHVVLNDGTVSISDKNGNTAKFSAYQIPELRGSLLEVEKKFGRRFMS